MRLGIVGAGRMARAIAHYLLRIDEVESLVVVDRSEDALEGLAAFCNSKRLETVRADASDTGALAAAFDGLDGFLSAASYRYNLALTRLAAGLGAHMVDLGGNVEMVRRQMELDSEVADSGVTVIPDCGLAPGLATLMAADLAARLGDLEYLRIRVGGLPLRPEPPLDYALFFSAEGLINEYKEPAEVLRDGHLEVLDSLTELEHVAVEPEFPELEAFITSGGTSTLPLSLRGKVRNLDYKTIRYPGHCEKIRLLFDLGLAGETPLKVDGGAIVPRRVLEALLEQALPRTQEDVVIVRVSALASNGNRASYELVEKFDPHTGLTAMQRTTGFPAAAALVAACRGEVKRPGVLAQEVAFEPSRLLESVRTTGIEFALKEG